jgi:hypothetical protein
MVDGMMGPYHLKELNVCCSGHKQAEALFRNSPMLLDRIVRI